MTHEARVAPFSPDIIPPVAEFLRDSDREEIRASHGADPLTALQLSAANSTLIWGIFVDKDPIGVFGVGASSFFSDKGAPWLLATDRLESIGLTFLRQSRGYVQAMLKQHSFLENWVDARNVTSIKWLKWCGFALDDPAPFGVEGLPFHRFEMRD